MQQCKHTLKVDRDVDLPLAAIIHSSSYM